MRCTGKVSTVEDRHGLSGRAGRGASLLQDGKSPSLAHCAEALYALVIRRALHHFSKKIIHIGDLLDASPAKSLGRSPR